MRHSHRSHAIAAVLSLLLALTLAAGYGSAGAPPSTASALPAPDFAVRVALLAPLEGDIAGWGAAASNGVALAIQTLARGWTIDVVEKNTSCDGATAVAAANEVVSDGIHYLIGDVCSGATIPISEVAEDNAVLMISPTASAPEVTSWPDGSDKEFVFRAVVLDDVQGVSMASLATGIGARNVVVMRNPMNPYSNHLAEVFATHLQALGFAAPQMVSYSVDNTAPAIAQLVAADPDAVYLPDFMDNVNTLLGAARDQGIDAPFLGSDGWDFPTLNLNDAEGCYFPAPYVAQDSRPVAADFRDAYRLAYVAEPDSIAAHAYDAMALLLTSIAEAGVDDAAVVRDALRDLTYEGVTGRMSFDAIGDPIKMLGRV